MGQAAACRWLRIVLLWNILQWKPFNPILGETYQSRFNDGTKCFLEQTSHHPPVSHFEVRLLLLLAAVFGVGLA